MSCLHLKKQESLTFKAGCAVPSEGLGALAAGVAHTLCPFLSTALPSCLLLAVGDLEV